MEQQSIRVVVIDDEIGSVELMEQIIACFKELKLVGTAGDAMRGLQVIQRTKPDIVFLDIHMPGISGLELAEMLMHTNINPKIVFVTAYNSFYLEAIHTAAFDYLLKPIDPDDLKLLLQRYLSLSANKNQKSGSSESHEPGTNKVRLNVRTGFLLVEPSEIVIIKADGNYSDISLIGGEKVYVSQAIGHFCELLPSDVFIRISRSAIINMKYLWKVDRKSRMITLKAGEKTYQATITREQLHELEERTQ